MKFSSLRSSLLLGSLLLPLACGLQEHPHAPTAQPGDLPGVGGSYTPPPSSAGGSGGSPTTGTGGTTPAGGDGAGGSAPRTDAAPVGGTPRDASVAADAPLNTTPPPPLSGAGININGVNVPKEKAIVFIHFGHSNMAGLAQVPNSLRSYHFTTGDRLWSYQGGGRFVPAKEPTVPDPPVHLGAGPGMAWLRAASAAAGPDYHFISIGRARGSAPSSDFLKGALYYSDFMDRAIELKGKVTFGGVFIMLGITDRHLPPAQQGGYTDRLVKIIADIRADLGEPNLPIMQTDYELTATGDLAVTGPVGLKMRPQILALVDKVPRLAIVPTDGIPLMPGDDHHFDMTGQKMWADRGIQIMIAKGWFPFK